MTSTEGQATGDPTPDMAALENRERNRPSGEAQIDLATIHERALLAAKAALEVKGEDVKVLDMHALVSYTDFMVLCTGRNTRLTRRIAEEVGHKVKKHTGTVPLGVEGTGGDWILMDFVDFVVHIFTPQAREFYRLDMLWKQAPAEEIG